MSKWFKGYFISSTYAQDISNQSCITNRETPCTNWTNSSLLKSSPARRMLNFEEEEQENNGDDAKEKGEEEQGPIV